LKEKNRRKTAQEPKTEQDLLLLLL